MNFPEEGLDAEHLRRVIEGYRARVFAKHTRCPYPSDTSFYFMWMQGWNQADQDLNYK